MHQIHHDHSRRLIVAVGAVAALLAAVTSHTEQHPAQPHPTVQVAEH